MEGNGKSPGKDFFQHSGLLQVRIEYQGVADTLGHLEFRRENEEREKYLDARTILEGKVVWRDLYECFCLFRAGIAGHIKPVFYPGDNEEAFIPVGGRLIAHLEGYFDKYRLYRPLADWAQTAGFAVIDIAFCKRKRRQETEIEVVPNFEIGHNPKVEPCPLKRFHGAYAVAQQKLPGTEWFEI